MSGRAITAASHGGFTIDQIGGIAALPTRALMPAAESSRPTKQAANGRGE
jgi:hypothetical protein